MMNNKKRIFMAGCVALFFSLAAFCAEPKVQYISPNNDGVKDVLTVPLKVREKRYIKAWSLVIYNEQGQVVRTISNKRSNEEHSVSSFFKGLSRARSSVEVPDFVVWNGLLGEEALRIGLVPGDVAPDGSYFYVFSATDDKGNTGTSAKYEVIVDTMPPTIQIYGLSESDKSFGEGTKPVLKIRQRGSSEENWTATILSANGTTVKRFEWRGSSPDAVVEWNGMTLDGSLAPDGIYSYNIVGTDKAGNVSKTEAVQGILFSAQKPAVSVSLDGSKYFSPNGDGKKDSVKLLLNIPASPSPVLHLTSWALEICGAEDEIVYRRVSGTGNVPSLFSFDGLKTDGSTLPDGSYIAKVYASYSNGYEASGIASPVFVLDTEPPSATVSLGSNVFNGSRALDIAQEALYAEPFIKGWTARIVRSSDGSEVRSFDFGTVLPSMVRWDGADESGSLAEDGDYCYELSGLDMAENAFKFTSASFTLDTSGTDLSLTLQPEDFSPNGDGVKDAVTLYPFAKARTGIASYTLSITDKSGKTVKTFSGTDSVPSAILWDGVSDAGALCEDGEYNAVLKTLAKSGTKAESAVRKVRIDTAPPNLALSVPYRVFSPTKNSQKQEIKVLPTISSKEKDWLIQVLTANGEVVRSFVQQSAKSEGEELAPFVWNGSDDNGNKVADGTYRIRVSSLDSAGNTTEEFIEGIVLDTRECYAYLTASESGISPNGDGFKDEQVFSSRVWPQDGIEAWTFAVVGESGDVVYSYLGKKGEAIPELFKWNGKKDGEAAEGNFTAQLDISYEKGTVFKALSASFISTVTPPVLTVSSSADSAKGTYFSPDNDGTEDELVLNLGCTSFSEITAWSLTVKDSRSDAIFWKTGGKSMANTLSGLVYESEANVTWDGIGYSGDVVMSAEDYPFEYTVTDALGLSTVFKGIIPVDVLVVLEGGRLKMQVPAIVFRGDAADFLLSGEKDANGKVIERSSLTLQQKENNIRVLRRIAQILKKFDSYSVTVVGHANPMSGGTNSKEETDDGPWGRALRPLSLERAQYVRSWLINEGHIKASRLKAEGKGGSETIANPADLDARWKNRRVEFILEK